MGVNTEQYLQILMIEDSRDDAFALERAIKKEGFCAHCHRVENADQLQAALEQQQWEIVLCDVHMPVLSVHEAIKIIDQYSATPVSVVIVSGVVDVEEISEYIRGGVRDFVRKDELAKLGDILRRELGYIEARREQESEHERFVEAQKMEAVGTLAGGVAHDFNNILTALMAMQWQIKSEYADHHNLIKTVDKMDELCDRASSMVKQLLGFARKGIVDMQDIDIGAFLAENFSLFRLSVPETIRLNWQRPSHTLYIHADSVQLQQMLVNLVNNARDAVVDATNPCISIVINEDPDHVPPGITDRHQRWLAIEVMDNGPGMDEQTKKHLFEPFYTTKGSEQGTGLGLAMVYGSMITHHGFVDCEPDACQFITAECSGCAHYEQSTHPTCMRLLFPIVRKKDVEKTVTSKPLAGVEMNRMHVLFADDEAIIRDVFCAIFEDAGSEVDAFENGELAWEQFRSDPERYDVVVLDVSMPKMTGPEVARNIRDISAIPIVLISGYDVHSTLKLVEHVPNIHVQVKPFQPDIIFSEIKKLTGGEP